AALTVVLRALGAHRGQLRAHAAELGLGARPRRERTGLDGLARRPDLLDGRAQSFDLGTAHQPAPATSSYLFWLPADCARPTTLSRSAMACMTAESAPSALMMSGTRSLR